MARDQKQERARLAAQRSRAKRRKSIEDVRARSELLAGAVVELVENSLDFCDVIIDVLRRHPSGDVKASLETFIAKTLTIARRTQLNGEEEDDNVSSAHKTDSHHHAEQNIAKQALCSPASPSRRGKLFPKPIMRLMPLGVLPSLSGCSTPPLDAFNDLDPKESPFAALLFWNTVAFARAALEKPSSLMARNMFSFAMPYTSASRQRNQIGRRLRFKPASVLLVVPLPDDKSSTYTDVECENVGEETRSMQKEYEDISEAMVGANDSMSMYLSAIEVESYLTSRWGLDIVSLTTDPKSIWRHGPLREALSVLIGAAKCLGNRPGFPIASVDEAAIELLCSPHWS